MNMNMDQVEDISKEQHDDVIDEDDDNENSLIGDESLVDFDDPKIANLPRILMMGPRRAGKTSIQRVVFHKMSPHETLFRLEATQTLERSVVDHTPLCRFTIWDFPGDYYGPEINMNQHHEASASTPTVSNNNPNMQQQQQNMNMSNMIRQPPVHASSNNWTNSTNNQASANTSTLHTQYENINNDSTQQQSTSQAQTGPTTTDPNNNNNSTDQDEGDAYVFGQATALIFVLDAQDEPYDHVLQHFTETVKRAAAANPHIAIEVFINKVDGELFLSDEAKYDCRRDVMQQVTDELADAGVMPDSVPINYHLTSIYDHSVFEAFSRVVQKLIPQLPTLENLLNVLVSTCAMEKAYLFDVASKLYISTDSSPVDMQNVELCSDFIDCVLDVSGIYGITGESSDDIDEEDEENGDDHNNVASGDGNDIDSSTGAPASELMSLNSTPDLTKDNKAPAIDGDAMNTSGDVVGGIGGEDFTNYDVDVNDELVGTLISQGGGGGLGVGSDASNNGKEDEEEVEDDSAYDNESASVIRLSKGMVLYMKEVDTMLALVCLTRADNFRKRNLINYNIGCLKKALRALVKNES